MMRKKRSYEPEKRLVQRNLRIDKLLRLPLPQRYQTTLECNITGIIPTGAITLPNKGFKIYQVKGNDLHLPFSVGGFAPASSAFTLANGAGTLSTSTLAPAGYANFMSSGNTGFYNYSRVLGSKLVLTVCPQLSGDACSVVLVPVLNGSATMFNSVVSAASAPFARGPILCTGNNNVLMNRIQSYISTAQMFGVTPSTVKSEDNYRATADNDTVNVFYWYILVQLTDAQANQAPISIDCRVKYYVEFEQTSSAGLLDVEV